MNQYSPIIAAIVAVLMIAFLLRSRFGKTIQDIPNERSLHVAPTLRVGGVGLMTGLFSGWLLMFPVLPWWILLPLAVLFLVSLLDDMHNLAVKQRLLAQLAAATILVWGADVVTQNGFIVALLLLLFTVWMTNLYNFMDGSDGLAGGMALFGFGIYGVAAMLAHGVTFSLLNFAIAAAALGFLKFNFPPAKVFMGDAGSIPLGFLVAAMGLWGWQLDYWHWWFPLLVFSPFIMDASVTLVKRSLRGAKITEAHREHYYQRTIQMGSSHRKVVWIEYSLMALSGAAALSSLQQAFPWAGFIAMGGLYSVLMAHVDKRWKAFERERHV
jgi:UDP-N-acetylmuramyl pentapeptide phosphotransferase/UDP-N-acetylglucosamine-1-phosphate transferase